MCRRQCGQNASAHGHGQTVPPSGVLQVTVTSFAICPWSRRGDESSLRLYCTREGFFLHSHRGSSQVDHTDKFKIRHHSVCPAKWAVQLVPADMALESGRYSSFLLELRIFELSSDFSQFSQPLYRLWTKGSGSARQVRFSYETHLNSELN